MYFFNFIYVTFITTLITVNSLNIDTLFCVANYENSIKYNTTNNMDCTLFYGSVNDMCNKYIIDQNISPLEKCYTNNLKTNINEYIVPFVNFIKTNKKEYYSISEIIQRFYVYIDNMNYVNKENSKKTNTYILGDNNMADLSNMEYIDLFLNKNQRNKNYCIDKTLPESTLTNVDWLEKGAVTPVKDQGQCGSCWAFSTVGALEGLNAITNGFLVEYSEQELVSCSSSYGNYGCNGGLMQNAFSYVIDNGITSEQEYPYLSGITMSSETCKTYTSFFKINKCYNVPSNEMQLTQYLNIQPVSVSIEADSRSFQLYKSGVYNDQSCGTTLDHGVLAVGYGTMDGQDYYKVKNSWSNTWGNDGYIYIARNSITSSVKGMCGIAMDASVPSM